MPYVNQRRRDYYDVRGLSVLCNTIREASKDSMEGPKFCAGDLAYIVFRLLLSATGHAADFDRRTSMMGGVDEARMEYRRRVHEVYEDAAIEKNGDIEL